MKRKLSAVLVAAALGVSATSNAANILYVQDFATGDTNIVDVLRADGHTVTARLGGYNATTDINSDLTSGLAGFDGIYWNATAGGFGDVHAAAQFDALLAYVQAGGRVFVTGYDTVASPTDPNLIAFVGATTSTDFGGNRDPGPVTGANSLSVGRIDIRGVIPTGAFGDWDTLYGLGPDTTCVAASVNNSTPGGCQWTIRTLGLGEIVYISAGASGTSVEQAWANTTAGGAGAYNAALRNFALALFQRLVETPVPQFPTMLVGNQVQRLSVLRQRLGSLASGSRFQNNMTGMNSGDPTGAGSFWADGRNGMFINASHTEFDKDRAGNLAGYDGRSDSLTAGFDRKLSDTLIAGVAVGYDKTKSTTRPQGFTGDADSYGISVYGRYLLSGKEGASPWYADGVAGFAQSEIDSDRAGNTGSTTARQFFVEGRIGTERALGGGFILSPYGGLQFIDTRIGGYVESGTTSAVTFGKVNTHAIFATFGGEISTTMKTGGGWTLKPKGHVEARQLLDNDREQVRFTFNSIPGTLFTQNIHRDDDRALTLGVGIEAQRTDRSSFNAGVSATQGSEGTFQYTFTAGARINF